MPVSQAAAASRRSVCVARQVAQGLDRQEEIGGGRPVEVAVGRVARREVERGRRGTGRRGGGQGDGGTLVVPERGQGQPDEPGERDARQREERTVATSGRLVPRRRVGQVVPLCRRHAHTLPDRAPSGKVLRVTPVGRLVLGLLVVLLDVRVQGWDLLPDPVGFLLACLGLRLLTQRVGPLLLRPELWAAAGVVPGLASVYLPPEVTTGDGQVAAAQQGPGLLQQVGVAAADGVTSVLLVLVALGVSRLAGAAGRERDERWFRTLAIPLAVTVVGLVAGTLLEATGYRPGLPEVALALGLGLVVVAAVVVLLVSLIRRRDESWLGGSAPVP